jgi:hypothetical protein
MEVGVKIRVFITTGDELILDCACTKFGCKLVVGGPPNDHDGTLDGFERLDNSPNAKGGCVRYDWMVVYIIAETDAQVYGVRAHFKHTLECASRAGETS